jgi:hypothetical protein
MISNIVVQSQNFSLKEVDGQSRSTRTSSGDNFVTEYQRKMISIMISKSLFTSLQHG